ncbi:hypothetical protein CBS101457_002787 [Exobasidium rhododendri]|nr:hypothetical protein CBS101457_002787 [Exobasidium rhododendri]
MPKVRSITICVRPMGGIAHTKGNILDDQHKEIHLSADYVLQQFQSSKPSPNSTPTGQPAPSTPTPTSVVASEARSVVSIKDDLHTVAKKEIKGVIVHELVHALQCTGKDTCPGGLIEGIADWVRLQANLAPPHWTKVPEKWSGKNWNSGYQTTAYFLVWASHHLHEPDLVPILNQALYSHTWKEGELFRSLFNQDLDKLWKTYKEENGGSKE